MEVLCLFLYLNKYAFKPFSNLTTLADVCIDVIALVEIQWALWKHSWKQV